MFPPKPSAEEKKPLIPLQRSARDPHMKEKESEVGTVKLLGPGQGTSCYYCALCNVRTQDDLAYLEHINGWRHNKMLGMSMTVKHRSANDVSTAILKCTEAKLSAAMIRKEARQRAKEEKLEDSLL